MRGSDAQKSDKTTWARAGEAVTNGTVGRRLWAVTRMRSSSIGVGDGGRGVARAAANREISLMLLVFDSIVFENKETFFRVTRL